MRCLQQVTSNGGHVLFESVRAIVVVGNHLYKLGDKSKYAQMLDNAMGCAESHWSTDCRGFVASPSQR